MGVVFGLFLGAMGDMQPLQMVNGRQVPQAPFKEQVSGPASVLPVQCGWCRLFRVLWLTSETSDLHRPQRRCNLPC